MIFYDITKERLIDVQKQITPFIHKTSIIHSTQIDALTETKLFFKCESFQKTGSFKIRGATNAIINLCKHKNPSGVVTHSSGNFAQALAKAANNFGLQSWIIMPTNATQSKKEAVVNYGGTVVECEPTLEAREKSADLICQKTGAEFIHPYNQVEVIEGQATCAMELFNELNDLDYLFVPVGGGGLLSGSAIATQFFSPKTKIFGAEPLGANDCYRSFHSGTLIPMEKPQTIADGLRTSLGSLTFPIIQHLVNDIITVEEDEIIQAMKLFWSRTKVIIEPSSAVAFAAVLKSKNSIAGKRVGVILSGGNVDLNNLPF